MGLRDELLTDIEQLTNLEDMRLSRNRLSAAQVMALYDIIFGEKAIPEKGKKWHLKKIGEEVEFDEKKRYRKDMTLSTDSLKLLRNYLRQEL